VFQIKAFLKRTSIAAVARRHPVVAIYAATAAVTRANAQAYFRGADLTGSGGAAADGGADGGVHDAVLRLLLAGVV
jgi:hypothetical protein